MVLTTPKAFDEFKNNLQLSTSQRQLIQDRQAIVEGHLRTAFPATSTVPLSEPKLIGSASRDTLIPLPNDIDLMAVFSNKEGIFEKYRHDSSSFLYRVRDALAVHSRVQVVGTRGQAVRFFYASGAHVDVAPIFKWNGDGWAPPNGHGGWLTTDPIAHATHLAKRHADLGSRRKPMTRMLKRWNNVHSKHLKSFHLEIIIESCFTSLGGDSRHASEIFFRAAQSRLDVHDPAGHGGMLSNYLTPSTRQLVLTNLESARDRATKARAAESAGNHTESIRLWRIVFGEGFPVYG